MNSSQFREAGHEAIEKIAEYYEDIDKGPIHANVEPGFLRKSIPASAPDDGEAWKAINDDLKSIIQPGLCHWSHPGFMAYFPASSTFEGILGEMYSAAFNNPAFDWVCSPSITELENIVMDWLVKLLALPDGFHSASQSQGGGIIMGSTTECLIATMAAARDRYLRKSSQKLKEVQFVLDENEIRKRLVVLGSSETHPSTRKAASIVGVKYRSVTCSPKDGIAMTETQLRQLIDVCLSEDLIPFYLTATLGTTNSCAIDDLAGIDRVVRDYPQLWVHVDAAFAGAALVCEEYQHLTESMRCFQSFSVNLGKWLLTNLDSTALLVRETAPLTKSLNCSCSILTNDASKSGRVIDYRNWQLSMGRRFRALKVWFVLRSWGKYGIQQHIHKHIGMAKQFTIWVQSRPDLFEFAAKPQFALNVIKVSPGLARRVGLSVDNATARVFDAVNSSGEFWLSNTKLDGSMTIRIISANPQANLERLEQLFHLLVRSAEALSIDVN